MKNVKDLRNELTDLFENVKNDKIDIEKAKVLVSASNSIIKSAGLELEHSKFSGSNNEIEFLKTK